VVPDREADDDDEGGESVTLPADDCIDAVVAGLKRDLDDPSHEWPFKGGPFDPWLEETFQRCNAAFFDGRVPPCRCFWFDSLFAPGTDEWVYATGGFCGNWEGLGWLVGVNSCFKLDLPKAGWTLRHEMVHALLGEPGHGPAFREALRAQNRDGVSFFEEQVLAYEAGDLLVPRLLEVRRTDRSRGRNGALVRLRWFLNSLQPPERAALIDNAKGPAKTLLLRALEVRS
jgi:hypothetical protein